jgi:hypothetical protein
VLRRWIILLAGRRSSLIQIWKRGISHGMGSGLGTGSRIAARSIARSLAIIGFLLAL